MIGPGRTALEADLARFARLHLYRRARRPAAGAQTVDRQRRGEIVPNRQCDLRPFDNANERRGDGEGAADFAERFNLQGRACRPFWLPAARWPRARRRSAFQHRPGPPGAGCRSVRRSRMAWPSPRPPDAPRSTRQWRERKQLAPQAGALVRPSSSNSHGFRATAPGSGSRPDMVGSCAAVSRERTVRKRASTGYVLHVPSSWQVRRDPFTIHDLTPR